MIKFSGYYNAGEDSILRDDIVGSTPWTAITVASDAAARLAASPIDKSAKTDDPVNLTINGRTTLRACIHLTPTVANRLVKEAPLNGEFCDSPLIFSTDTPLCFAWALFLLVFRAKVVD